MNLKKNFFILKDITKTFGIGFNKAHTIFNKIGLNNRNNPLFLKKQKLNDLKRLLKINLTDKKLKNHLKEIGSFSYNIRTYKCKKQIKISLSRTKNSYKC